MRIVAKLLLYNGKIIQSKKMSCHSIVGDVENGLFFLNKWNFIDEIAVYDISTRKDELFINRKNVEVLKLNHKPISYGGQISSLEDVKRAIAIGFDKVIINSNKYDLELLNQIKSEYGRQSVVIAIDLIEGPDQKIFEYLWREKSQSDIASLIALLNKFMPGEIIINWINKDGQKTDVNFSLPEFLKPFRQNNIVYSAGGTIRQLRKILRKRKEITKDGFSIGTALWHQNLET